MVLELPFNDAQDEANGGDAPYDSIVNSVPYDLEDYWTHVYPEIADGKQWTQVHGLEPYGPDNAPMCGDQCRRLCAVLLRARRLRRLGQRRCDACRVQAGW